MVQRKTKPHFSKAKDREIAENREGVAPRKSVEPVDQWVFLDEIEAPMWLDLNLEATFGYKDNDDDWFQISHPLHHCSSHQLISAFSHVGKVNTIVDFGIQGPSSPNLPPSVSRSRGKHYRRKEWGQINFGVKLQPVKNLGSKSSWVNSGSGQKMKPHPSNENEKGNVRSKANFVCESSLTETGRPNYPKPSSNVGELKTRLSSAAMKEVENKSASTITSESSEQQNQKLLEVSCQTCGHTSGLLSALKVTLRKSCVTRQASRVEIAGGRQSEGCKSSSGKSSVGSSSHPGHDVNTMTLPALQNKDTTPDSRNIRRMPQATKDKVKVKNTSKESTAESQVTTSKSRWGSKTTAAKLAHQQTEKSKVNQVVHSKAMRLHRVNESATAATKENGKVGVSRYNRPGDGKENGVGRMTMSERSNTRAGGVVQVLKVRKQIAQQTGDRTGLVGPKGKISGRGEGKSLTNAIQKVYFR